MRCEPARDASGRCAEHDYCRVDAPGEVEQRGRHVIGDERVVAAAAGLDEQPLRGEVAVAGVGEPAAAGDVHRVQHAAACCEGGSAAHQPFAVRRPGEGHDHPLARGSAGHADHGAPGAWPFRVRDP